MVEQETRLPRARIVVATGKNDLGAEFSDAFAEANYVVESANDAASADIAMIDARGASISAKKASAIISLIKRRSPDCAPIFLVDEALDPYARASLARHGEVLSLTFDPAPLIVRIREIIRLRNVAEETGERLKTLATLNRLSDFPAILTSQSTPRILIAGRAGREALSASNCAKLIDAECASVFTAGQVMRALDHATFDCAAFIIRGENDPLLSLAKALRRHPTHCALPIITVAASVDEFGEFAERGARDFAAGLDLGVDFANKLRITARRGRLMKSMRGFLQTCNGDSVRDPISGAFTPLFLTEHAPRVFARADQTGRVVSVCALKLTPTAHTEGADDFGNRALRQASRLINRITRAEDIVARIAPNMFVIMFAATNADDAHRVSYRVNGVIENSVFRGRDDRSLFSVATQTAIRARHNGECVEELVADMMRRLQEDPSTAPRRQSPQ